MPLSASVRKIRPALLLLAACCLPGVQSRGCPVCPSETGRAVRAGILDDRFGGNLAITALPFVVLGAIVAGLHHAGRPPGTPPEDLRR